MILEKLYRNIILFLSLIIFAQLSYSQELTQPFIPDLPDYEEVYRDTIIYDAPTVITMEKDSILEPLRVVTNTFGKNWFLFASGGVLSFHGDYSNLGPFKGTLSPSVSVGVGKWFTPGVALKVEFERSASKGYTAYETGHYGYGEPVYGNDGQFLYRHMRTDWWDVSASAILNLTRLIRGYEGMGVRKHMNQFLVSLGLGMVHHMGLEGYGSDNELSAHLEFQYSRFFTPAKRWSLDIKARGIFYQSNFDLEYGQADHVANKVDFSYGLSIGATLYLGKTRDNGWSRNGTKMYVRDYREQNVTILKKKEEQIEVAVPVEVPVENKIEQGALTFYVFYPNNYSGRNDAPIIADADVNAIDYLAGGLYTQKKYSDTSVATARLKSGQSTTGLKTQDIPTEIAEDITFAEYMPRGYEMESSAPLSLSLKPEDMLSFEEQEGFVYAPIYDGQHTWQYRIDDAALGQQLLNKENYAETQSFGINSHEGLDILRKNMRLEDDDQLVSFADVYAALNGNEGHIAKYTDEATVKRIKDILENGVISLIQVEGMATSQDNHSGSGAQSGSVSASRNTALADNRAESVLKWLQQNENLAEALAQRYSGNGRNTVNTVNDKSTRGLNSKLNRGVKVRINYMKR